MDPTSDARAAIAVAVSKGGRKTRQIDRRRRWVRRGATDQKRKDEEGKSTHDCTARKKDARQGRQSGIKESANAHETYDTVPNLLVLCFFTLLEICLDGAIDSGCPIDRSVMPAA